MGENLTAQYVTCPCQHCGGNIEFDSNQVDVAEILTVPCPHCELQTRLLVPDQQVQAAPVESGLPLTVTTIQEDENSKAAEQDSAEAKFKLGMIYYCGVEKPRDFAAAAKLWREAAEQGHPDAQFGLGCAYKDGTGVSKDTFESLRWFRMSAGHRNPYAQFCLGLAYWLGEGVPQDYVEAVKWFHKAADQGHPGAQLELARAYGKGKGVVQNLVQTTKWLRMAAEQGNREAAMGLGIAYQDGKIFPELNDLVEAYKWTVLATTTSGSMTKKLREMLAEQHGGLTQRLTSLQMQEGERLASIEALKIQNLTRYLTPSAELNRQRKAIRAAIVTDHAPVKTVRQEMQVRTAISSQVRREVWRRDGGACVKCGSRRNLEFDHIVPVSKGGSNTARNIELLCESCNRSKSNSIQ